MKKGLRNCQPITIEELDREVKLHKIGMLPEYRDLDNWMRCEVEPQSLRDMHGVFARDEHNAQLGKVVHFEVPLCKGARFDQLFTHLKPRIDSGDFPAAADIRSEWLDKPPVVVLRMVRTGELYLCDGEKRVFNACYHGERSIRAFVVHVDEDREVVEHFPISA